MNAMNSGRDPTRRIKISNKWFLSWKIKLKIKKMNSKKLLKTKNKKMKNFKTYLMKKTTYLN